jgi:hypothetical protein
MEDDWGVKPPGRWASIDIDDVAKRFNVLRCTVRRIMKEVEVARRYALEEKLSLRFNNVQEYVNRAYDDEAARSPCKACGAGPFDTWDELVAHVRWHLLTADLDDPKLAGTAQRTAADTDKLLHPQHKYSRRERAQGLIPPNEDPLEIEARVRDRENLKLGSGS